MERIARRYVVMIASAGVLVGSPTTDAFAEATRVPTSGQQCLVAVLDPGTQWVSEDGVLHTRDEVLLHHQTGDLEGDAVVTGSTEIDLATCQGRGHVTAVFTGVHTPSGVFGTFESTAVVDIQNIPSPSGCQLGTITTIVVGQGGGGFAGMKRFAEIKFPVFDGSCQTPFPGFPSASWEGSILDPSGTLQP